ncbi:MAG: hypothetical protein ABSD80_03265 [Caulobacteraceae bacterium]|jgi:hypothetical protein
MGKAFAAAPLLLLPAAAYNILVLALGGFASPDAAARIADRLFELPAASGGVWEVSYADLLLAGALIVMFVELIKSTHSRRVALINHILSIALFVACLAELLLVPACATSTFFLIALMVLLDVLAGFILGVSTRGPAPEAKPKR